MTVRRVCSKTAVFAVVAFGLIVPATADEVQYGTPAQIEFFEKDVRPLLAKHCYECHSGNAKRLEGNLFLDSRQGHLNGGDSGAAIVPGAADKSLLIESVRYESYEMPPNGKLSDAEIAIFVRWIDMGAPWPSEAAPAASANRQGFDLADRKSKFWLWQPIEDPVRPLVDNEEWPRDDIDHFILAKLEQANLQPARDADRAAILRRLNFDLIGLPPTPEEVAAFVADDDANALETAVDRLLASPHFGERWARHWLDLVRYAESRGHEFDNDTPNAFQYRDYVIRALNADVPYDQFVREHIAGDLLAEPRRHPTEGFNESILGTGFWFLGEWVHSPVDIRKDEADRFDNMIDVMSKSFLGVTVACARCHDHKFDAISTADYYSLSGFLQSSDYRQVRFESMEQNRRIADRLAEVDNKHQRQIVDLLDRAGIERPSQSSFISHDAIIFDFATLPQTDFVQDGFVFGRSPRREGWPYLSPDTASVFVATHRAAVNDPIWFGLESVSEGVMQDRNALAKLPKSGRTLRSPTFELRDGTIHCRVDGVGHVVACVDSHRLVSGPLHGETVVAVKEGQRWVRLNSGRYVGHRLHLEFVPAKNEQLSVRLVTQGLDGQGLSELDRQLAARDEPFRQYAAAADMILKSDQAAVVKARVFADFESGTYDDWTVTGDAFGEVPQTLETIATYQGKINGEGRFFVNSHNIRPGGDVRQGDGLTGTLTSPAFEIDFDHIEFLVGGGNHQGKTCVNLIVDDEVVRSVTGRANNQMFVHRWDVREYAGKSGKIEVVDQHKGGWGNIGIDHIVFVETQVSEGQKKGIAESPAAEWQREAQLIIKDWRRAREELASKIVRKSRVALAMLDGSGEDDHILIRGNASKPGAVVPRHFLTAVSGDAPMEIAFGSGRLELAAEINDPTNPLTSRVIVNRIWHHLMGRGIVPTVDDFGYLGQRPTHPRLLDHLATRFLKSGRSVKSLIKDIVLSRTYQMSSHAEPDAIDVDPTNQLCHHCPPRRLEGEVIRDSLLAIAGRLDRSLFGPPIPIHLTSFMDGRGRPGKSGPLDGDGRRSIYISVRRNFLSPFMLAFDTPVPFSSMGRRNVSNVPAQALILLNDPLVVELSRDWARRALDQVDGDSRDAAEQRVVWMYQSAFGREPTQRERDVAVSFVESQASDGRLALDNNEVWEKLAHVLVNTKEFVFLR